MVKAVISAVPCLQSALKQLLKGDVQNCAQVRIIKIVVKRLSKNSSKKLHKTITQQKTFDKLPRNCP